MIINEKNLVVGVNDYEKRVAIGLYEVANLREFVVPIDDAPALSTVLSAEEMEKLASAKPPVPETITSTQGKLALLYRGLLDDAEAAIEAMTDPVAKRAVGCRLSDHLPFQQASPG